MFIVQLSFTILVVAIAIVVVVAVGCDVRPWARPQVRPHRPYRPILLVFTADWCEACKRDEPEIESLKRDGFTIEEYDGTSVGWEVEVLPTYIIIDEYYGEFYRTRYISWARNFLENLDKSRDVEGTHQAQS